MCCPLKRSSTSDVGENCPLAGVTGQENSLGTIQTRLWSGNFKAARLANVVLYDSNKLKLVQIELWRVLNIYVYIPSKVELNSGNRTSFTSFENPLDSEQKTIPEHGWTTTVTVTLMVSGGTPGSGAFSR